MGFGGNIKKITRRKFLFFLTFIFAILKFKIILKLKKNLKEAYFYKKL
jgi:hypothetical protein